MKKILVVDDEPAFCRMVKLNLEGTGEYQVSACSESSEAVRLAKEMQPDLILLDILMPKMSGPDVMTRLRAEEGTQTIPIVFITAIVTPEESRQRNNAFGNHYVVAKPIRVDELRQTIENSLQNSERYQSKLKQAPPPSGFLGRLLGKFRNPA